MAMTNDQSTLRVQNVTTWYADQYIANMAMIYNINTYPRDHNIVRHCHLDQIVQVVLSTSCKHTV